MANTDHKSKQVKVSLETTATYKITCQACKCVTTHTQVVDPGWKNDPAIVRDLKFHSFNVDRDRRTYMGVDYLICNDCALLVHDFLAGRVHTISNQKEQ